MKQRIRIWLRNFFGFSRTESNGFIILNLLMVIILFLPIISRSIYSSNNPSIQSPQDKLKLTALLHELERKTEFSKTEDENYNRFKEFDLNKSNIKHLSNSGFPAYLAKRIVKYRQKVKPFESKEELLKIYGIDSSFYKEIRPYIKVSIVPKKTTKIPQIDHHKEVNKTKKSTPQKELKKTNLLPFDINNADSLQLQKVYGIGPAYSKRIIKYREYLGGFHSILQLEEVYGLKKQNLDSLKKYTFIKDSTDIKQLKVNILNADSLVQHPYISYREANIMVNYRKQHGVFNSAKDLLSIKILDSNWVKKVKPYLSFE